MYKSIDGDEVGHLYLPKPTDLGKVNVPSSAEEARCQLATLTTWLDNFVDTSDLQHTNFSSKFNQALVQLYEHTGASEDIELFRLIKDHMVKVKERGLVMIRKYLEIDQEMLST